MPKLEDLPEIKKKIQKTGNEIDILKKNNMPYNDTPIPNKDENILNIGNNIKKDDNLDDLLSDIREDFQKGNELKDEETIQELDELTDEKDEVKTESKKDNLEDLLEEISIDNTKKTEEETLDTLENKDMENLLSDIETSNLVNEEEKSDIPDNLDDLLQDIQDEKGSQLVGDMDKLNETEEKKEIKKEEQKDEGLESLLTELGGLGDDNEGLADADVNLDNLIKTEKEPEEIIKDEYITETDDLSDLMINIDDKKGKETKKDSENLDNLLKDLGGVSDEDVNNDQGIDELNALLGESVTQKEDLVQEEKVIKEEDFVVDENLADLAGELKEKPVNSDEEIGYILEKTKQGLGTQDAEEDYLMKEDFQDENFDHILDTPLESAVLTNDKLLADEDFINKGKTEEADALKGLEDLSLLEEEPAEIKDKIIEKEKTDVSALDFESLDSLGELNFEAIPTEAFDDQQKYKMPPPEFQDSSYGKLPEELSKEDIKHDQDIELKFNEDERKQIVISLTNLPKQAELKISKAIISNKYSNIQIKPLIEALIDGESAAAIIKYYEKITGDKSLSTAEALKKFRGEKFEEMQRSFGYLIQKNLLPLLVRLLAAGILIFSVFILIIRLVVPTFTANIEYNNGLKKIDQKEYWEAENFFERGFNIQPRFSAILKYAKKYRENKRILEAEKKYEHALSWKPDRKDVVLEYADFFREIKSYERAEKKYKDLLKLNDKDIKPMLGLAKTYFDWSHDNAEKLLDAEDIYKDVLTLDNNNKEALFGNLNVYLKMKNHKKIIAQYSYISKKVRKRADPETLANFAEYLNDRHDFTYIKEVIEKAYKSVKKNQFLPEIDYQNARYKKALKIFDEEKKHLEDALIIFDRMKISDQGKYESKKYQNLLARVYNDMGENYDRKEKASIEAEKYYNKSIQIYPDYGLPYYNLGNFSFNYKENGYDEAKSFYELALEKGFINDRLNYNLARIYYKDSEYYNSFLKINRIMDKIEYNSNINFMAGTIYYRMDNYDLAESLLLESYININNLISKRGNLLNIENEEDKELITMMMQISNNLGATYQKKYEKTKNTTYLVKANKHYSDSILRFVELNGTGVKGNAHINLRMVLYPYSGIDDPLIYEYFPDNY
ncbi:MAG: hypothetical protein JXB50_03255 [Spirochaetes bacterium]|nr:hypothetical protein [Spirochaetota bacterium]